MNLAGLIDIVRFKVPSPSARNAPVLQRVLLRIALEAIKNLCPEKSRRYLPGKIAVLKITDDVLGAARGLDLEAILTVIDFEGRILTIWITVEIFAPRLFLFFNGGLRPNHHGSMREARLTSRSTMVKQIWLVSVVSNGALPAVEATRHVTGKIKFHDQRHVR